MLPFHNHRHRAHMSFTAVLGMDVIQHRLSGERSWVSNASVKFVDALGMRACTTGESRTRMVFSDAVHNQEYPMSSVDRCDRRHLLLDSDPTLGAVPMPLSGFGILNE